MTMHRDRCVLSGCGFALTELMVTLSVSAILPAVSVPAFNQVMASSRLTAYANDMFATLVLARSEAVKRNQRVVLCKSADDGQTCAGTGGWEQGWIVFVDLNNDASRAASELIVRKMPALPNGYALNGNTSISSYVSYDPQGMTKLASGAFQAGTFTLCPPAPAASGHGRKIVLSASGRSRISKITNCA
ncbi:MAG: prepilin-type N-terminal cleavage/methylation domain-containing protein [Nitrosomonadales bacterium]|nr:MAG: prepilin-type N-terminal cleavage/methylation domain-containing protein [Nitrosomonadales bacterium]